MDAFKKIFHLPDPDAYDLYEPVKTYVERKEEFPVILSTRLGFLSAFMSLGFETLMTSL